MLPPDGGLRAYFQVPAGICAPSVRCLNLHEHDSKGLLAKHNVRVQRFKVATIASEAKAAAEEILNTMGEEEM